MKKSVKEEVEIYLNYWWGENPMRNKGLMRIIRRACNEAKRVGIQAGFQCAEDAKVLGGKKAAMELADEIASLHVSEIINGPKKGKRK